MAPSLQEYLSQSPVISFQPDSSGWQERLSTLDRVLQVTYKDFTEAYRSEIQGPEDVKTVWFIFKKEASVDEECLRLGASALGFFLLLFPDFDPQIIRVAPEDQNTRAYLRYTEQGIKISTHAVKDARERPHSVIAAWLHELVHLKRDYDEAQGVIDERVPLLIEFIYPFIVGKAPRDWFSKLEHSSEEDKYYRGWQGVKRLIAAYFKLPPGIGYQKLVAFLSKKAQELLDFLKITLQDCSS